MALFSAALVAAGLASPGPARAAAAGLAVAWGNNSRCQIAMPTCNPATGAAVPPGDKRSTPLPVVLLPPTVTAVAGGEAHSLALLNGGVVLSWGSNDNGQLGALTDTAASRPQPAPVLTSAGTPLLATAIAAGRLFNLALLADGTVRAWGSNGAGQLGNTGVTTATSATPVTVGLTQTATAVAAGGTHALALLSDGTVKAWGDNHFGQLGDGTYTTNSATPVTVGLTQTAVAIAAGNGFSLALLSNGTVKAWGNNEYGQLGTGNLTTATASDGTTITANATPVTTSLGTLTATAVDAGLDHALALISSGTVQAWGHNQYGQVGKSDLANRTTPVAVSSLSGVKAISAGGHFSLAVIASDGSVQAWGNNQRQQLGNDGATGMPYTDPAGCSCRAAPVPVFITLGVPLTAVSAISAGTSHALAAISP